MTKYVYRLIAFKDGRKWILAEYRGDDTGFYGYEIERVETRCEKRESAP